MDDLSRALDNDLLKDLECPVCMEYMVPPIKFCTNGHNICKKCRRSVQNCPTCRANFSEIRNVALENIARRQKYPCANRQNGCLDLFSIEHIAKHQAACVYGIIKCPLHLIKECSWRGLKSSLKEHAKVEHPAYFFEKPNFRSPHVADCLAIVSYFGKLFTFYKYQKGGRHYAAAQLIGTSREASKYKCEFTLRAANGIERIITTFLVHGYSDDFEAIFKSGKCLNHDEETVKNFVKGNEIQMDVVLSKV